jgi:hypothetical protein
MRSPIIAKAGQSIKQSAAQTAKQIVQEIAVEIPKKAIEEVVSGPEQNIEMSTAGKSDSGTSKVFTNESAIEDKKTLDYLRFELEELERKKKESEVMKNIQEQKQKEDNNMAQPKPQIEKNTKRKIGLPFFGKKQAKGTGEMLKSMK